MPVDATKHDARKPSAAPELSLRGVCKSFGEDHVLDGFDLDIFAGEYLVLLGPSGCGKSTLLQIIAGLISPDAGELVFANPAFHRRQLAQRDLSILFQDDRLYPHWNLRKNLAIASQRSLDPAGSDEMLRSLTRRLGIDTLLDRRPDQISGGQLRRAALAKALLRRPAICLLDEPLTAIDTMLREEVLCLLADYSRDRGNDLSRSAIVHVTHDGEEAMRLADRIVVMGHGRVLQSGTPEDVYRRPCSIEIARAIGTPPANCLAMAGVRAVLPECYPALLQRLPGGSDSSKLVIRPEDVRLTSFESTRPQSASLDAEQWIVPVIVQSSRFVAGRYLHRVRIESAAGSACEPLTMWSVGPIAVAEGQSFACVSLRRVIVTV